MATGNIYLDTYGPGTPADAPAPQQAAPPPQANPNPQGVPPPGAQPTTENEPAGPPVSDNPYINAYGPGEPAVPEAPPAPPAKKKGYEPAFLKGAIGQSNRLLTLLARAAGQSGEGLDTMESNGQMTREDAEAAHQEWSKNFVEPYVQAQSLYDLPQDASFVDKAFHGLGSTAMFIAQAIATGGAAGGATASALGGGRMALAAGGAVGATVPAVANAVETGHQVLKATGDQHAATIAGVASYFINAASAAVPMGIGGNLATRLATAGGAGVALGEASRVASNATMPESMQQPWSLEEDALSAVTSLPFGLAPHPAGPRGVKEAGPQNAMEEAQIAAARAAKDSGADALGQVQAAVQVNSEVGAVHDAAATHAAREARLQAYQEQAANEEAENLKQGVEEKAWQARDEAQAPKLDKDEAFAKAEAQQAQQKDRDFEAARNQVGDEQVAAAAQEPVGAEKGGALEPGPTLADVLPPDQLAAFEALRANRAPPAPEAPPAQQTPTPGAPMFPDAPVSPHFGQPAVERGPGESRVNAADRAQGAEAGALAERRNAAAQAEQEREESSAKVQAATAKPGGLPPAEAPQTLQERRNAAVAAEQETPPPAPKTKAQSLADKRAEAKAAKEATRTKQEEEFEPLPNDQKVAPTPEAKEKAPAPAEEEEDESEGPPPVTAQTLAQRRQQALDDAMAAKVRGAPKVSKADRIVAAQEAGEPQLPQVDVTRELNPEERQRLPVGAEGEAVKLPERAEAEGQLEERGTDVPTATAEEPAEPEQPKKTRMQMIREAAEKRRATLPQAAQDLISEIRGGQKKNGRPPLRQGTDPAEDLFERQVAEDTDRAHAAIANGEDEKSPLAMTDRERGDITEGQGSADQMERAINPGMEHDEAKEALAPITDAAAPRSFQVHDTQFSDTIPPSLARQINALSLRGGRVKGAFHDGVVHVFANSHKPGDVEDLRNTAIHEMTHKGLASLLGDDYRTTTTNIARDIINTKWAQRLIKLRGLNPGKNPQHLSLLGDEYVAHMAENQFAGRDVHKDLPVTDKTQTHWQRVVAAVRAGLRKLGVVKHWNDNDIARLIRQAQSHVMGDDPFRPAREGAAYKDNDGAARFSLDNDDDRMSRLPPDHPDAVAHKLARTVEEQGKFNPGFLRNARDAVNEFTDRRHEAVLGGIPLRNIPDFMSEGRMPAVHRFIDVHDTMDGRRRQLLDPDIAFARKWAAWKARQDDRGDKLDDLLGAANITQLDPSRPYKSRFTDVERGEDPAKAQADREQRARHGVLAKRFEDLGEEGKSIFTGLRDNYAGKREKVLAALEERIKATAASEKTKANALTVLRRQFEAGRVKGFYTPLQRFGDLWARAKNEDGSHAAFARFETRAQQKQWLDHMRTQGFEKPGQLEAGKKFDTKSMMERIDPEFVKNVMGVIKEADPTGHLAEDVWQEYLKAMPEMSMRKHMITRLGRLGFSGDHLRAFAYNAHHGAAQLARLEYGHQLDATMDNMKEQTRAIEQNGVENPGDAQAQKDAQWAPEITKEMQRRYDWIRNPRSSKLAAAITKFGSSWYLGASPATAFRIFTQNPMIAHPVLASRYGGMGPMGALRGQARATGALLRATGQWARSRGAMADNLRGDERKAFQEATDRGMFSDTQTQLMASGGDGSPLFRGPWYHFQRTAGFLFNAMEHHNRMTTFLAAYRLGKEDGLSHDDAFRKARNATWDSHGDYTNANRPRYMQSPGAKVVGLFKQYPLLVTYRLAREFNNAIQGETPEARSQAQQAFGGLMGRMMLFAGITGTPMYWAAEKLINSIMGSKDEPYDMTAALHKHLNDTMGQTVGDAIMTGPVGAISGASLSGGASYNDLWYRNPNRNESTQAEVLDAVGQLAGPIAAIPVNAGLGADQFLRGNKERGLEHFLPPEASSLAKAYRYATEGATNTAGQNILPADQEITSKDVALQALGFTPQKVADAYARNTAIKNEQQTLQTRHQQLTGQYESALLANDAKGLEELQPQVQAWNSAHPELAIGPRLYQGIINQAKRNATNVQGLNLPRGYEGLEDKY